MSDELTRTELRRIAEEFKSERDAAKRDVMRMAEERDLALSELEFFRRDAMLFRLWVDEAAHRPSRIATALAGCITPIDYRIALGRLLDVPYTPGMRADLQ